jgi:hypothetical protein
MLAIVHEPNYCETCCMVGVGIDHQLLRVVPSVALLCHEILSFRCLEEPSSIRSTPSSCPYSPTFREVAFSEV